MTLMWDVILYTICVVCAFKGGFYSSRTPHEIIPANAEVDTQKTWHLQRRTPHLPRMEELGEVFPQNTNK